MQVDLLVGIDLVCLGLSLLSTSSCTGASESFPELHTTAGPLGGSTLPSDMIYSYFVIISRKHDGVLEEEKCYACETAEGYMKVFNRSSAG